MKGFEYALHRPAKCPEMISESSTAIEDRRFKNFKFISVKPANKWGVFCIKETLSQNITLLNTIKYGIKSALKV
jgi:hypothetical protein